MPAAGVVPGIGEGGVDVADMRQAGAVDRLQIAFPDQGLYRVAGGHQEIIAGGAGFQLGQHLFVVGIIILLEQATAPGLEAGYRRG